MTPRGARRAVLAAAVAGMLAESPARAHWQSPWQIVHGTANTLENGEWMVGVLTPVIYGISDDVTFITHPVMWVLLTPNGGLRWRMWHNDRVAVSAAFEFSRTFLEDAVDTEQADPRPLGHVHGSALVSVRVGKSVILTLDTGYQRDLEPADDAFVWSATVTWVMGTSHLLMAQGGARYSGKRDDVDDPSAMLMYAYAFDNLRLGIGVMYGDFPIVRDTGMPIRIPVWPVLDAWWRF